MKFRNHVLTVAIWLSVLAISARIGSCVGQDFISIRKISNVIGSTSTNGIDTVTTPIKTIIVPQINRARRHRIGGGCKHGAL